MLILNYDTFNAVKKDFLMRHGDWSVETSPMDEYGTYYKDYICEDGAQWHEVMRPVYEKATVEVKGVKVDVTVKLLETEAYNTDDSVSIYYYEKFNHEQEAEI